MRSHISVVKNHQQISSEISKSLLDILPKSFTSNQDIFGPLKRNWLHLTLKEGSKTSANICIRYLTNRLVWLLTNLTLQLFKDGQPDFNIEGYYISQIWKWKKTSKKSQLFTQCFNIWKTVELTILVFLLKFNTQ